MTNPLIRKLEVRDHLSEEERQVLNDATARTKDLGPDQDVVREGDRPSESTLLIEGFICRYKLLGNGRRQITALHVAGDFVDLHSFLMKTMDHSVATLTHCKVALVPHERLREIADSYPHLGRMLWLNTLIDGAIHRRWITAMGRQSATSFIAHLLCELFFRLKIVGLAEDSSFELPITQSELGDALGLSTVHVNRVLQDLRERGLITWRGQMLVIDDWDRLVEEAQFDPIYLNLDCEPR